jgi:hypothetical protein
LNVKPDEVIILALGVATAVLALSIRSRLKGFPLFGVFASSYIVLLAGWIFTILEDLLFREAMNMIEHFCYSASAFLLAVWCWRVFVRKESKKA